MRLFNSERISGLMDKMGHKEGEVLQHSMITKSIERAQKKVEENNFGIRKRLLEYDDVMNSQRDVIYKRRNHALFGDRLSIDLDNAIFDVCTDLAMKYDNDRNFDAFRLDVIQHLAMEPMVTPEEFAKGNLNIVGDNLYHQAKDIYTRKMNGLREHMLPTLTQILEENGDRVENIVIPFTDGVRGMQVYANLKEAVEQEGRPITQVLEKSMTLAMIDDAWKDHLRAMDDLRTSVQMASFEQKDPLLIYKFEAFNLFKQMLLETNRNIVSFLLRAGIPIQEEPHQPYPEEMPAPTDMSHLQTNSAQVSAAGEDYAADENDLYDPQETTVKRNPVQSGPKIGRNDPCPCGSGRKYKQCHGRGL
jgi:preprotein translocase subunit SecA